MCWSEEEEHLHLHITRDFVIFFLRGERLASFFRDRTHGQTVEVVIRESFFIGLTPIIINYNIFSFLVIVSCN